MQLMSSVNQPVKSPLLGLMTGKFNKCLLRQLKRIVWHQFIDRCSLYVQVQAIVTVITHGTCSM